MRETGIDLIGRAPWGTHFCQFYETAQDLREILVPYFAAGLKHNEFCMWITSEPLGVEEAKTALEAAVGDLEPYLRSGQLEILDYSQWYSIGGVFEADRVLQGWVDKLTAAQAKGFEGLRLTGNTFWLERSDWHDFTEYEATVDSVIGQYQMLAICTYSLAKCGAPELLDVMANHAFALIKRGGAWQIIESAERKRAGEALRESEQRWATTLSSIGDAVIATDAMGVITFLNPVAEQLTGWSLGEATGKPVAEVFHIVNEQSRQEVESPVARALREGTVVGLANHTVLLRKDGTELPIDDSGAPIRDERGKVVGVVLVFRDITERKQAEETLRESQAALQASYQQLERHVEDRTAELRAVSRYARSLIEASLDPLVTISPEGKVTDVNKATELVTGISREHLIGSDFSSYFTEPDRADAGYREVLATGEVRNYPLTIRHKSGRTTDVLYHATVYRDEAGQVQGVFAAARDITERKKAEAELAQYRDHLEELVNARTRELQRVKEDLDRAQEVGLVGSWRLDVRHNVLTWSEENHRIFGIAIGTPMTYETFLAAVHPDDRQALDEQWNAALRGAPYELEHRIVVDGSVKWLREKAFLEFDESGELIGGFGISQDITNRKEVEEALSESEETARIRAEELQIVLDAVPAAVWIAEDPECLVITGNLYADELIMNVPRGGNISRSARPGEAAVSYRVFRDGVELKPEELPAQLATASRKSVFDQAMELYFADGRIVHLIAGGVPLFDAEGNVRGSVVAGLDVTQLRQAEQQLLEAEQAQVRLAQTLTSEIAHRTKNNLAIVAGLLQMQLDRDSVPSSQAGMIEDAVTRIMSFAALHEQMYQRHSDRIELVEALRHIAEIDRQALSDGEVTIEVEGEPVEYPSSVGTNFCVVANELLTNAIKHGGASGSTRKIVVQLGHENGSLIFTVKNTGNAVPADFDVQKNARTGLGLVRTIVEDQYHGSFTLASDQTGTMAQIMLDDEELLRG